MVLFDSLLRSALCASCFFCLALRLSKSEDDDSYFSDIESDNNVSSNNEQTAPLIMRLLKSVVEDNISDGRPEIDDGNASSSQEDRVMPTPLIVHLNRSTAQLLMQEANNMFVSNISFSDLMKNNETHQMLLRYRERKRQARILTIQLEILQKLGLKSWPNVTARFSAEERQEIFRTLVGHQDRNSDNETTCVVGTDDEETC